MITDCLAKLVCSNGSSLIERSIGLWSLQGEQSGDSIGRSEEVTVKDKYPHAGFSAILSESSCEER